MPQGTVTTIVIADDHYEEPVLNEDDVDALDALAAFGY